MIRVIDMDGRVHLLNPSQIAEVVEGNYTAQHNAAIRQVGIEGWLRVREKVSDIELQIQIMRAKGRGDD